MQVGPGWSVPADDVVDEQRPLFKAYIVSLSVVPLQKGAASNVQNRFEDRPFDPFVI